MRTLPLFAALSIASSHRCALFATAHSKISRRLPRAACSHVSAQGDPSLTAHRSRSRCPHSAALPQVVSLGCMSQGAPLHLPHITSGFQPNPAASGQKRLAFLQPRLLPPRAGTHSRHVLHTNAQTTSPHRPTRERTSVRTSGGRSWIVGGSAPSPTPFAGSRVPRDSSASLPRGADGGVRIFLSFVFSLSLASFMPKGWKKTFFFSLVRNPLFCVTLKGRVGDGGVDSEIVRSEVDVSVYGQKETRWREKGLARKKTYPLSAVIYLHINAKRMYVGAEIQCVPSDNSGPKREMSDDKHNRGRAQIPAGGRPPARAATLIRYSGGSRPRAKCFPWRWGEWRF